MLVLFAALIIIASIILGLIVLIQNPKGGGLAGSLGGFSNQLMGVKQTTDALEKGTWIFAAVLGILCMMSPLFIKQNVGGETKNDQLIKDAPSSLPSKANNATTLPGAAQPAAPATPKP